MISAATCCVTTTAARRAPRIGMAAAERMRLHASGGSAHDSLANYQRQTSAWLSQDTCCLATLSASWPELKDR